MDDFSKKSYEELLASLITNAVKMGEALIKKDISQAKDSADKIKEIKNVLLERVIKK